MKKKVIKISLFAIFITILTVFGIFNLINNISTAANGETSTQSSAEPGTLMAGENDPSTYSYKTNFTEWTYSSYTNHGKDGWYIPDYTEKKGYEVYCVQPDVHIGFSWDITYAEYDTQLNEGPNPDKGNCYLNHRWWYLELNQPTTSHVGLDGKEYTFSWPYPLSPQGHPTGFYYTPVKWTAGDTKDLSPALAYIVSDGGDNTWSKDKQQAMWNLAGTDYTGDLSIQEATQESKKGQSLLTPEAKNYADYDDIVRPNDGLQPKDSTEVDNVTIKVDQGSKEYTAGPFKLSYTNGIYGDIAFSGISDMKLAGFNINGDKIATIKIKQFIIDGKKVEPKYFKPDQTLKTDKASNQQYPLPDEEFEVIFDNPNEAADELNRVVTVGLEVKFQYMLANGEYTYYNGEKHKLDFSHPMTSIDHKHLICGKTEHTHGACQGPITDKDGNVTGYKTCNATEHTHVDSCYKDCGPYECKWSNTDYTEQDLIAADAIRSIYEQKLRPDDGPPPPKFNITMDLGGNVWEDGLEGKESLADGKNNTGNGVDKPLKNIKVTLYEENGQIAKLAPDSSKDVMYTINPTYTNENGNYLFTGLDSMKKYYVTFEYNGQIYLPTEYGKTSYADLINWKVTSKGTETVSDRDNYDNKFAEIRSYPENYKTSNSLGKSGTYNASYSQLDLMGYTLDENGKYHQTNTQLVDGYKYDEDGLLTTEFSEGAISKEVRTQINQKRSFPTDINVVYNTIAKDEETWKKLQFIEDCKIQSYTQAQNASSKDLYPEYTQFVINKEDYSTVEEAQNNSYDMSIITLDGKTYKPIYPAQYFVNQGLWRRQEFDVSIKKDVYRAVTKINDKTTVYKYSKRTNEDETGTNSKDGKDNNTEWDINIRMSDYDSYYGTGYTRNIYNSDYKYSSSKLGHPGDDLEVYVTYKITLKNQSLSTIAQINELVDYYDSEYELQKNLSWIIYKDDSSATNINEVVDDDTYYKLMSGKQSDMTNVKASDIIKTKKTTKESMNARAITLNEASKYGQSTHSDIATSKENKSDKSDYDAVYISGLEGKKLASGENAYVYLTFKVKKDNDGKIVRDEDGTAAKQNLVEVNGYETYYRDNTKLPNSVTKNSTDHAGLLDRDSNPGNLMKKDLEGDKYQKNFEDDTDEAPSLRVKLDKDSKREINGIVWEDKRDTTVENAVIGNGIRDRGELTIRGVTVQLVEKTVDGKEYVWQETTTDQNGKYTFEEYIPGNYVVRFYYGNSKKTVDAMNNGMGVSYNGQDFKSTTYQKDINQEGNTDTSGDNKGYTDTEKQNETGTYGYNIYKSDSSDTNYSDAKDLYTTEKKLEIISKSIDNTVTSDSPKKTKVSEKKDIQGRKAVIKYSEFDVTNYKAEILASPDNDTSKIDELIKNTYMTAETGVIVAEFEYDRQQTDGSDNKENTSTVSNKEIKGDNSKNGTYALNNVDLGLVERPKAQLEIDKSITNIKVTLANNTVLFDVNKKGDNVVWKDHTGYNLNNTKDKKNDGKYDEFYGKSNRYNYRSEVDNIVKSADKGLVQLTMDEELMHGATIEITYRLAVTNDGEVDYKDTEFYYNGKESNKAKNIVTTNANQVVDYVANNLQFNSSDSRNNGWSVINQNTLKGLVANNVSTNAQKFNTIIQTPGLSKDLKPGDVSEKTLVLSQLITAENKSDDLTYRNITEIVKTSNTVGRRMAYSIVGNQDPTVDAQEVDASVAEKVIILPPFGSSPIYYILGITIGLILIGGITLIIRKVLRK